ncbi:MAG: nucleotidyl transferase AbiEii/AbiGii toxin family protein, partial [Patescibacteria group bacterium]
MSKLYFEILDQKRKEVFEKLSCFKNRGVLAGGTGVALQLGHRYSYDFDIFTPKKITKKLFDEVTAVFGKKTKRIVDQTSELSFITTNSIKVSFVYFPFPVLHPTIETNSLSLFSLKDLASNKAYTIGRRGEYRDYVDVFFILKSGLKLDEIIKESTKKFSEAFSGRLFLEQ